MLIKKKMILLFLMMVILPLGIFPVTTLIINNNLLRIMEEEIDPKDEPMKAIGTLSFYHEVYSAYFEDPQKLSDPKFYEALFVKNREVTEAQVLLDGQPIYEASKQMPHALPTELIETTQVTLTIEGKSLTIVLHDSPIISKIPEVKIRRMAAGFGFMAIMLYLVFSFLFLFWVIRSFLPPFAQLKQVANRISLKDYDIDIDTTRQDEIGEAFLAFEHMRQSIQSYENNRKELIANISHDLKTPITAIKGYVTAIQDGIATSPEKMDKYVNVILNNTLHMEQLVDDLFLYSKLDVNQLHFDMKPIELEKYVEYMVDDIQLELEPHGIDVTWTSDVKKDALCLIDPVNMQRVIHNIVSNARKHYDKAEKTLQFHLTQNDTDFILTITDNGEGIPEEDLDQVFNRFYRGDSSRNTATGSTGLGLAICQQIIEKHKGTIAAHSPTGQGTTILIKLPIVSGEGIQNGY